MAENGRVDGDESLQDINPQRLREDYLVGIDQYLINPRTGKCFGNKWYDRQLARAMAHVEKEAQVSVKTRRFLNEPHDYYVTDYKQFAFMQLFNRPMLSVEKCVAVFPTGELLFDFPKEWLRPDTNASQLQIVPTHGSLSQILLGRGGDWLPTLFNTITYLPGFFQVSYTCGWPAGKLPEDIVDTVFKRAAIDIAAIAGDLVYGPGVSSVSNSINGMSESRSIVNNGQLGAVFTSRIAQYRKDLYGEGQTYGGTGQIGQIKRIKQYYGGIISMTL